jgi:hypothetical protein
MRRVGTTVAALAVTMAGLVTAGGAQAQTSGLPACADPGGVNARLKVRAPSRIAFARSFSFSLDSDYGGAGFFSGDAFATFGGPDGAPLEHGYADAPINGDHATAMLAPGETTGVVGIKTVETDSMAAGRSQCQRVFLATVPGFDGEQPSIGRRVKFANKYYGETDRAQLTITHPHDCADAAFGPITVTVKLSRQTVRLRLNDQCGHTWKRSGSAHPRGWQAESDDRSVLIGLTRSRAERRTFAHLITKANGGVLQRGHIRAQTDYRAGHTVWEGTDAFINYCIDKSKDLRSEGGKLNCWYEGYTERYYDFTK